MTLSSAARSAAAAVALLAIVSLAAQGAWSSGNHPQDGWANIVWRLARYFTILTNAMVAWSLARAALGRPVSPIWLAGLTLWIAMTGALYHLLLAADHDGLGWWADEGVHTAVPIATALWWLAFVPKAGVRWRHAAVWLAWPALYVIYALGRGAMDGVYPYFFTDPGRVGWNGVALWTLALTAAFWVAGLAVVAVAVVAARGPLRASR